VSAGDPHAETAVDPIGGVAPEPEIARDMVRRGLWLVPAFLVLSTVFWGLPGLASSALALALVFANFLVAAGMLAWAARVSIGMLMGAALGGFVLRLGFITVIVLLVINEPWIAPVPLGLTLVIAYLALLVWELKYISASLAYPALKPRKRPVGSTKE
jgi:hypothetical protein